MNDFAKIERVNIYRCRFSSSGLNYSTWKNSVNYVLAYEVISNGVSGWGESTFKYKALPLALKKSQALVGRNVFDLEGCFDNRLLKDFLFYQAYLGFDRRQRQIREGLSMALWDLAGKLQKKSFYELSGRAKQRSEAEGLVVIHVQPPGVMKRIAQTWYSEGYRKFKLKLRGEAKGDVEAIAKVKSLGSDVEIVIVDANYGYKKSDEVIRAGRMFSDLGVGYFQNPIRRPLLQYPSLSKQMGLSFTSDNTSYWPNIRRVLRHNAAKLVNLHPNCIGGVDYLYKIIDFARSKGIPSIMDGQFRVYWNSRQMLSKDGVYDGSGLSI